MFLARNFKSLSLLLVCVLTSASWSQVSTSRIEGTVADTSSAVVSNASVKVTNEDTGVRYETKTSTTGSYTIPSLSPGMYTVTVSVA